MKLKDIVNTIKYLKKYLAMLLLALVLTPNIVTAQSRTSQNAQELYGEINLTTEVDEPYPNSRMQAYPDGKDYARVVFNAINKDGTYATNLPLIITKPSSVELNGLENTSSGSIEWHVTSTRPIRAKITVRLKDYPQIKTSFTVNFRPSTSIKNLTDTNSFLYNLPVTFTAQIDPGMVAGVKEAKLVYSYNRRVNKWGRWVGERRQIEVPLTCSEDGYCYATINTDNTSTKRVDRGRFNYKFVFLDQNGTRFSRSYNGMLKMP